jgi:hypothetical protein
MIKSRRMRWVGYVAHMGAGRGANRVLLGKPDGKSYLKDLGVDGSILLKRIFKKWDSDVVWV